MQKHKYSFIIPVFNRPDEVEELLESITKIEFTNSEKVDFELVIVEDGSTEPSNKIIDRYKDRIEIKYLVKPNTGCSDSRNYGAERATGDYLIQTDSDVMFPPNYIEEINKAVIENELDAFGGPDAAHSSFSKIQRATSYSMTSFFTTGGIRNKKKSLAGKYFPRSFNFGVKKDIYLKLGGFPLVRNGEDTEFSVKLFRNNYKVGFVENAIVYHKRKTSFKKYFKQVYWFARARVNLNTKYPETSKLVFYLPSLFTLFAAFFIISSPICIYALSPLVLYALLVFIDSTIQNKSITIGAISIITSFIQHFGYGIGFMVEFFLRYILRRGPSKGF
jgi:glycosyltransferase involved in cell wall biosynthesis